MTVRRQIITSLALLPLLFGSSHAAQDWSTNKSSQSWDFSSDEGGNSYLGIDIADITVERMSALKLKEEKGVEVTMVDQDSPAGKAGIKEHDVILTMKGMSVESAAQLRRMIHETPPGRVVALGLSRDGQPVTVNVQLADRHKEFSFVRPMPDVHVDVPEIHIPDIDIPSMNMVVVTSSARSGLMVENITPQLGDFFGVKNGNGVLIRSVEKGSRAEQAGFRAGDVIVKINGQAVHDTSDFSHAVRSRNGNSVSVGVIRDKREQTLTLSLPARKESGDLFEEETFDQNPMMQAESSLEVSELRDEIAKLQPQIELAAARARQEWSQAEKQVQKSVCDQQRKLQKDAREQSERALRNYQTEQHKLEKELNRMVQQMRSDWL
jgi:serine protease Do